MREPTYYIEDLRAEIALLRMQRDTARRMYCQAMAEAVRPYRSPEDIAIDRGWNCFKENTND